MGAKCIYSSFLKKSYFCRLSPMHGRGGTPTNLYGVDVTMMPAEGADVSSSSWLTGSAGPQDAQVVEEGETEF